MARRWCKGVRNFEPCQRGYSLHLQHLAREPPAAAAAAAGGSCMDIQTHQRWLCRLVIYGDDVAAVDVATVARSESLVDMAHSEDVALSRC